MNYTPAKLNLGCGSVFIDSPEWINLDFETVSPAVRQANLLERLPLADKSASLVYSSHFLEHVPRSMVPSLLFEWLRVLAPGGVVRLVVPDLENMAREYLSMRETGANQLADFVVLEMIDQCVRRESGGELGRFYRQIAVQPVAAAAPMIDYIHARTGEDLRSPAAAGGGAQLPPSFRFLAQSRRAHLDSPLPARPASRLSCAERQLGGGGGMPPLAVGLPSAQDSARGCRFCRCAKTQRQQQCRRRLSIPSIGRRSRGTATQGGGVTLRGGAQARLEHLVVAPSFGVRND